MNARGAFIICFSFCTFTNRKSIVSCSTSETQYIHKFPIELEENENKKRKTEVKVGVYDVFQFKTRPIVSHSYHINFQFHNIMNRSESFGLSLNFIERNKIKRSLCNMYQTYRYLRLHIFFLKDNLIQRMRSTIHSNDANCKLAVGHLEHGVNYFKISIPPKKIFKPEKKLFLFVEIDDTVTSYDNWFNYYCLVSKKPNMKHVTNFWVFFSNSYDVWIDFFPIQMASILNDVEYAMS